MYFFIIMDGIGPFGSQADSEEAVDPALPVSILCKKACARLSLPSARTIPAEWRTPA